MSEIEIKDFSSSNQLKQNTDGEFTTEEKNKARFVVYKNLLLIGLSWIFLFTAYSSISNLQSSLNNVDGLGTASLSTIYAALILSCIFLPTFLMSKFGIKWTIFFSQLAYILYIAANIYSQYYTLIPAAIILGCNFRFFLIFF